MNSIRWRIAVPYVILILGIILFVGGYLAYFIRQSYMNDLESYLLAQAKINSFELTNYSSQFEFDAPLESSEELDTLAKEWLKITGMRYTIIRDDGIVLGESHEDRAQMENHSERTEILQARENAYGQSIRYSETTGYPMMYIAVPIKSGNQNLGFVRVAMPIKAIQTNLSRLFNVLILTAVVASLVAILLAMWIASRTTRPLRELTLAASQMSHSVREGEIFTNKIEPSTTDEIGDLTFAFNSMAIRLRDQMDALETEQMKMAAVLGEMTDGVLIIDQKSGIQLINPAAQKIFETTKEAALGRTLVEVARHYQIIDIWKKCQETQKTEMVSFEVGPKKLYLQIVVSPLGSVLPGSTLVLLQDLTQLRKLETVRRDFISNISHELRTPLAALKALTETLQENALDDPPAARRFLQQMEAEVDALSLMVSELLELSRIESGKVPLQLVKVKPDEIIAQAVDRLLLQAERAGLTVTVESKDDLPFVLADSKRIEQVMVNLLHNAIKFTPAGGQIWVRAEETGNFIKFSVQDTGIGISPADVSRIFERFYKTDRARSRGGTGLGLAIARHMVEAHGGKIWAVSAEGSGSSFYFTIPKA